MTASSFSIGIVQCALDGPREANVARVETLIREAARRGAQVILTPELFEGPYFPQTEDEKAFDLAAPLEAHRTVARMQALAADLGVVLPISFFERAGQVYYNSLVTIDADGAQLGVYRKSHIPDGPGYEEKFYFRPGDTGFRVWKTRHGNIGVGICWDQWFPEAARSMALHRHRARHTRGGHPSAVAARDGRTRGGQRDAGRCGQSLRHRRWADVLRELVRL